jgi:hypothetical protein
MDKSEPVSFNDYVANLRGLEVCNYSSSTSISMGAGDINIVN